MTICFSSLTSRLRPVVGLVFVLLSLTAVPREAGAQIQYDLRERVKYLKEEPAFPDSAEAVRLDVLKLGEYHTIPNFLDWDFSRERVVEEYSLDGRYRVVFRHPNTETFAFNESREGVFILVTPRDLSTPGLSIELESIDDLAERIRRESTREVWRETTVTSVLAQRRGEARRGGPLNIDVPLPLPGVVEKIIGEGEKTRIDISGRESITIAGESRIVDPFIGVEGQQQQSLFPSLELRQELDVRLQGRIGEKVNIQVDHSSNAVGPLSNRIRLNYRGFEDDVVKLIEMGNTSLTLPGSQLVSFSGQAKGLFGVKALAQVGPMDLTVIASKEEGETSSASFTPTGGTIGQTEERAIRSVDYVRNRYFFLDNPYDLPPVDLPGEPIRGFRVSNQESLEVYVSVTSIEIANDTEGLIHPVRGIAWRDTTATGREIRQRYQAFRAAGSVVAMGAEDQQFRRLDPGEFTVVEDVATSLVIGIELLVSVSDRAVAVRYRNERGDGIGSEYDPQVPRAPGQVVGEIAYPDTLFLELIKAKNPSPTSVDFGYTWHFMMRNIYNLGVSSIDRETLEIEIADRVGNRLNPTIPEGSTVPWIRVYGLDRTGRDGTGPPDNRIDLTEGQIDFSRGTLVFPVLTPFDQSDEATAEFTDSLFSFNSPPYNNVRAPELYAGNPSDEELADYHHFDIIVRAQSTTRSFRIDAFNITPNSEVVKLDGNTLNRGRDYTINYDTGEVELMGDVLEALTPSSNITIDYEFTPLAGAGGSTLMGFNSIFNLSDNSKIGTTWLYESKGTASQKPRLGEEPTRAIVGDLNTTLNFTPQFLTDIVNWLPLVDTRAPSVMNVIGEVAMSMPDPNTRGEVYIDDFEGIEDSDIISMNRRNWFPASPPVDSTLMDELPSDATTRIFWYNIEPDRGVHRRDLNPNLDERESTLVPSLDIEFDALTDTDTTTTVPDDAWAGVMTGFRAGGLDLTRGQFIEVWINDFNQEDVDRGGVVHIDFGRIDEDYYNADLQARDTEDRDYNGFNATTEDTGLDGIFSPGGDPDDDWEVTRQTGGSNPPLGRFTKINGTEGNRQLDDEDIDGSGSFDQNNAYFSYVVDLASEPVVDVYKDYPGHPGLNEPFHTNDAWRLYRIKLSDHVIVNQDDEPDFRNVTHMRIWFEDINNTVNPSIGRIQFVDLRIVGNRWERDALRDAFVDTVAAMVDSTTQFGLSVINTKTNPEYYPPVRPREQDQIEEKEQSLLVTFENLDPGLGFRVRKRFLGRGLDFTLYNDFNHFARVDQIFSSPDTVEYYVQIALDSLNFYEIQVPVTNEYFPGGNWSRIMVDLNDLTNMKLQPADSIRTTTTRDLADPSKSYRVRLVGRPNLFNVRFLYAGLRNKAGQTITGEVWINDIYLGNRKRDVDFAQRFSTTINMGNIVTFGANWARTGPDFRGLRQRRGNGVDQRSLAMSAKTNLRHFVPLFGFNVPLSGNYSRALSLPKFVPNSDTEIQEASARDSLRSESNARAFSVTMTRQASKSAFMRYTFDKTKINFSASQRRSQAPSVADTSLSLAGTLDYSIQWGGAHDVKILPNVRFRYWPNTTNLRFDANRRTVRRWRNVGGAFVADPTFYAATLKQTGSMRYVPFRSLTSTFRLAVDRDVSRRNQWLGIDIGMETGRNQNLQVNFKPPPMWGLRAFNPDGNYQAGYVENSSPNVARQGDPETTRNASQNRTISVKASYDLGRYAKRVLGGLNLIDDDKPDKGAPKRPRAPADTSQTAAADTTETVDRTAALKRLLAVVTRFRRINASWRQTRQSNYTRIADRPSVMYQLGLTSDAGVTGVQGGELIEFSTPNRTTANDAVTLDTGVQLTDNIDLAGRFSVNLTSSEFREVGTTSVSRTNTKTTSWPDLNLSWGGLEDFPIWSRLMSSSTATFSWTSRHRETGRGDAILNEDDTQTLSPALAMAWKNGLSSNLSLQRTSSTSKSGGATNESTNASVSMDFRYSFAPGKPLKIPLPFLSSKVLRSRLDSNVAITYSRTGGRRSTGSSGFFVPVPKTTTLSVAPRMTYSFSNALNGSFFINYGRTYSEASDQTTTTIRVGIDAIFTF